MRELKQNGSSECLLKVSNPQRAKRSFEDVRSQAGAWERECWNENARDRVSTSSVLENHLMTKESPPFPAFGALLGLDFGTKRMGVAVSNSDQTVAVPVETWTVRDPSQNLKHLRELIDDYRAVGFVVGLPIRTDGVEGTAAASVREFGEWVAAKTELPLVFIDERYSSAEAELLIWKRGESPSKRKQPLDSLAAQIILQAYLDKHDRIINPPEHPKGCDPSIK